MSAPPLDRHFVLRKVHSLLGLVPVGFFLCFHLFENSLARHGADYFFHHVVEKIDGMPYIEVMEILVLALPILFHGIYGIVIWVQGKGNLGTYGYFRNWMYWGQRISGLVALVFMGLHVWGTRVQVLLGNITKEELYPTVAELVQQPWGLAIYVIGILAAVFHFSNGLWLLGITWGLTIGQRAQRISTYVTSLIGVLLVVFAGLSLSGFLAYDPAAVAEAATAAH